MARESLQAKAERTEKIITALRNAYPDAHCELNYTNPLELLIATILSAQCTDKAVNAATPKLFAKYRTANDYATARPEDIEEIIHSLGFFRNKTKSVMNCGRELVVRHGGAVPRTMEELNRLPGVGRKTANVVLGNAFGINEGVVVDTHVARLSQRLGLTTKTDPEKIEIELQKLVPRKFWTLFSHWLIWHGRRRCYARNPDCAGCEVLALCPFGQKNLKSRADAKLRSK